MLAPYLHVGVGMLAPYLHVGVGMGSPRSPPLARLDGEPAFNFLVTIPQSSHPNLRDSH